MRAPAWLAFVVVALLGASAFADGNVTATVSGRLLTLTGDGGANWVTVTSGGASSAFTVTPVNGTTVNGSASAATFLKVRSITAVLGAGDDRIDFSSVKVRGNVKVRLDDGNDSVYFTATSIRGRTAIRCGAGTDLVRTDSGAIFHGPVAVRGETGNDELQLVGAQFRNRLRVEGGGDDDHVLLQSIVCTETARVEVMAGSGLDLCELLFSQFANDVVLDMGPDNDRARIAASRFTLDTSAFGGLGEDDVLAIEGGVTFGRIETFDGFEEGEP